MITRGHERLALGLAGMLLVACTFLFDRQPSTAVAQDLLENPVGTEQACGYGPTHPTSQVAEPAIREASALVASQQWPGVYWTFNDSKNTPMLYAVDADGRPRGTFQVPNASNVDWEALQLGPDRDGGYALYIGDIGDNKHARGESVIYRV